MRIVFQDPKYLYNVFYALTAIDNYADIYITSDGFVSRFLDNRRISMANLRIDGYSLYEYYIDEEYKFNISLSRLLKVLKHINLPYVCFEKNKNDVLEVKGTDNYRVFRSFHIKITDVIQGIDKTPHIDYLAFFEIDSKKFRDAVNTLSEFNDYIVFHTEYISNDTDILVMDNSTVKVESNKIIFYKEDFYDYDVKEEAIVRVNAEILKEIANKAYKVSDTVMLFLKTHKPLKIRYNLEKINGFLEYYIAPQIAER